MYRSLAAAVALLATPMAWVAPAGTVDALPNGVRLDTTTTSVGQPLTLPEHPELMGHRVEPLGIDELRARMQEAGVGRPATPVTPGVYPPRTAQPS